MRLSNVQRDQELLRQADFLTTAAAEAAVRERSERAGTLDEVITTTNQALTALSNHAWPSPLAGAVLVAVGLYIHVVKV